jgi:uncharacterized protein YjbI with pentapeptide repeats
VKFHSVDLHHLDLSHVCFKDSVRFNVVTFARGADLEQTVFEGSQARKTSYSDSEDCTRLTGGSMLCGL